LKKSISFFGNGNGEAGNELYDKMKKAGKICAEKDIIVVTGAYGGVGMRAPMEGASEVGGEMIGYVIDLSTVPVNEFCKRPTVCRSSEGIEVAFGKRFGYLLKSDGFILAADGGPETMAALMAFVTLSFKVWRRHKKLAILTVSDSDWDMPMLDKLTGLGLLPASIRSNVALCSSPEQAVEWVS